MTFHCPICEQEFFYVGKGAEQRAQLKMRLHLWENHARILRHITVNETLPESGEALGNIRQNRRIS